MQTKSLLSRFMVVQNNFRTFSAKAAPAAAAAAQPQQSIKDKFEAAYFARAEQLKKVPKKV